MKTRKLKLLAPIFVVALLLPTVSQAYFSTAQSATRIDNDTILFTVTYRFGFMNRELYMPIGAVRGLQATDTAPYIGYTIFNNHEPTTIGQTVAVALSTDEDIQIRDGQYYLPQSKGAEFTLVALLMIPPEQQTSDLDLSLQVTRLPFTMIKDGTPLAARLNPSELQYYLTPEINFSSSISNKL